MEKRKLGPSGLELSLVGLGTNNFGGRIDLEASRKVVHKAIDLGITHFDTADIYGNSGGSETIIGEVLGPRRDEIVLATKFGKPMADHHVDRRGTTAYVRSAVEASLKRLRTDRIDLLWMHEPDPGTPIEETLRAVQDLVAAGKVGHLGASNFTPAEIGAAVGAAKAIGVEGFVGCQDELSLLNRAIEKTLVPEMKKHGLGLVPYFPLAGGALSGKYRKDAALPQGRLNNNAGGYSERFLGGDKFDKVETLLEYAEARGHTLLELAMSWLARKPLVVSIIAGATKPEQLEANATSTGWNLTATEMAEIEAIAGA